MSTVTMPRGKLWARARGLTSADRTDRAKHGVLRFGVVLAMVTALFAGLFIMTASMAGAQTKANEYSLYKLSSATSAYFGAAQSPEAEGTGGVPDKWKPVMKEAGSAGALLGYPDAEKNPVTKWLTSQLSGSSQSYNYDAFGANLVDKNGNGTTASTENPQSGLLNYAYFGAALNGLGLDTTSSQMNPFGFVNTLSGGAMLLMFVMAGLVDLFFWVLLWLMKMLNPFGMFYDGVAGTNGVMARYLGSSPPQDYDIMGVQVPNPFIGLSSFVSEWYEALHGVSMMMIPIFIAVLIVTLLLFRKGNNGGRLKKLAVRLVFITVGIPILGGLYTGALNSLMNSMGDTAGAMGANKVVLSTYVDFETWATKNRLYVPNKAIGGDSCTAKVDYQTSSSGPTNRSRAVLRNTVLCINANTDIYGDLGQLDGYSQDGSVSSNWNITMPGDTGGQNNLGNVMNTFSLLTRYMEGAQVSASSFETAYQAELNNYMNASEENRKQAKVWFVDYTDEKKFKKLDPYASLTTNDKSGNPLLVLNKGTGLKIDSPSFNHYPDFGHHAGTIKNCGYKVVGDGQKCNLSAMAMYNYLNTSFGPKSMTVYSSEKSSSGMTREMHNSVNQIGTGLMGFMYWFNSMVMLTTFVVVGLVYGLAMIIGNLRRTVQAIASIPFAMLGAISSIAKVITYSVAMIVEIIGTVFIYRVMQEIMLSLPQIVEMPLSTVANNKGAALGGVVAQILSGGWLSMGVLLVSSIFMIWFTALALKVRKGFINGINEAVTKVVEKFTDGQVTPPGMKGPSLAGALAGGAAGGIGLAAAGRAMSGPKSPNASGPGGPKGITSAGGTMGGIPGPDGKGGGPLAIGAGGPDGPDGPGAGPDGSGGDVNLSGMSDDGRDAYGGDGSGGVGGAGADGQQYDENGNPVAVDDSGQPIQASGEDAGASAAVAGSDAEDRRMADQVQANGLSTNDDQPVKGESIGGMQVVPDSETFADRGDAQGAAVSTGAQADGADGGAAATKGAKSLSGSSSGPKKGGDASNPNKPSPDGLKGDAKDVGNLAVKGAVAGGVKGSRGGPKGAVAGAAAGATVAGAKTAGSKTASGAADKAKRVVGQQSSTGRNAPSAPAGGSGRSAAQPGQAQRPGRGGQQGQQQARPAAAGAPGRPGRPAAAQTARPAAQGSRSGAPAPARSAAAPAGQQRAPRPQSAPQQRQAQQRTGAPQVNVRGGNVQVNQNRQTFKQPSRVQRTTQAAKTWARSEQGRAVIQSAAASAAAAGIQNQQQRRRRDDRGDGSR